MAFPFFNGLNHPLAKQATSQLVHGFGNANQFFALLKIQEYGRSVSQIIFADNRSKAPKLNWPSANERNLTITSRSR